MTPARRRVALSLALGAALLAAAPAGAQDAPSTRADFPPPTGTVPASEFEDLATRMAAPWPDHQRSNGSFRDNLKNNTRYGNATLGYALMLHGIRTSNRPLIQVGMNGITYGIRRAVSLGSKESVFENMAVAAAYNLGREHLAGDAAFGRVNGLWARYMRGMRATKVTKQGRYGNHYLPEAIAILEGLRSGVRSSSGRAFLGGDRGRARRAAIDLIIRRIPGMATREDWNLLGQRAFVLSDPPSRPPAYQGFSLGLYARAAQLLPGGPTARVRETIRRIVHASWGMTAPDGDVAFWGRSQQAPWSLAGTTFGAELAARLEGSSEEEDRRYRALADRTFLRLREIHGIGRYGLFALPALRDWDGSFFRGRDSYVGSTTYNGLTLMELDWAMDTMRGQERRAGRLLSDLQGTRRVSYGQGRFAVVRRGDLWYAVKPEQPRAFRHRPQDLRQDTGVVALKRLTPKGWRDIMPIRPRTDGTRVDSVGPILLQGSRRGLPTGDFARVTNDAVSTSMDFRTLTGTPRRRVAGYLRRGQRFTFTATDCGVRITFPARRGDLFEYSAILRHRQERAQHIRTAIFNDELRYAFSGLRVEGVDYEGSYASGSDVSLVRARAKVRATRSGTASITICETKPQASSSSAGEPVLGTAPPSVDDRQGPVILDEIEE